MSQSLSIQGRSRRTAAATVLAQALLLGLAVPGAAAAQRHFTVRPESRVTLLGKSNVHDWSCGTTTFVAKLGADSSRRGAESRAPATRLSVVVPVRDMDCGRRRMNDDMLRALKADSFPEIRYELIDSGVDTADVSRDRFTIHSVGLLTVAGRTQRVEIPVRAARDASGGIVGAGGVRIRMTDFGIAPPTAFLGLIRTKNEIEVHFDVRLDARDVAVARHISDSSAVR